MYGKVFASMYEGSMMGRGPEVFAVWPYILSTTSDEGFVEINPFLVAVKIGMKPEAVQEVLKDFLSPDPSSRSKELEGRKLEKIGEFLYRVVNHAYYRAIRNAEDRREQNRLAQERFRAKKKEVLLTGKDAEAFEAARNGTYHKRRKVAQRAGEVAGGTQAVNYSMAEANGKVPLETIPESLPEPPVRMTKAF